ncbi:hypothetical protein CYMTET_8236 [Cymbomonas tetramitiformis]|uniref:Glycosyltransferase 2-like domain-containing protein n=1 Tax=Cymbomonas tetramitiformis TaxID=36881 RepID=A0AAE0GTX7_9CHLO|nr:hypothetical protein CYMTET_8236 [Cymbomonas tetramitiformis]
MPATLYMQRKLTRNRIERVVTTECTLQDVIAATSISLNLVLLSSWWSAFISDINPQTPQPARKLRGNNEEEELTTKLDDASSSSLTSLPKITVIIPCYLPNERSIIDSTLRHVFTKLEIFGVLEVVVVYSLGTLRQQQVLTKSQSAELSLAEERLWEQWDGLVSEDGLRAVRIIDAHGTRTKAESLNQVLASPSLKCADIVAIYDADHHPDSDSLKLMVSKLLSTRSDCVQGSTYIRNATTSGLLGGCVNAEFFLTHFIFFPGLEHLAGTAFFGGSNAVWRAATLRKYTFDQSMQTEDIDLTLRALTDGHKITFCASARSGELAPRDLRALWHQRVRWALGWEQVTRRGLSLYNSKGLGRGMDFRKFLGIVFLFGGRLPIALLSIAAIFPTFYEDGDPLARIAPHLGSVISYQQLATAEWGALLVLVMLKTLSEASSKHWLPILMMYSMSPLYMLGQLGLMFKSICDIQVDGDDERDWVVTLRSEASASEQ